MVTLTDLEYEELIWAKKRYESFSRAQKKYREKTRSQYNEYHKKYYHDKKQVDNKKEEGNINNNGEAK